MGKVAHIIQSGALALSLDSWRFATFQHPAAPAESVQTKVFFGLSPPTADSQLFLVCVCVCSFTFAFRVSQRMFLLTGSSYQFRCQISARHSLDLMGPPPVWAACPAQRSYSGQQLTEDTPPVTHHNSRHTVIIHSSSRLEKSELHEEKMFFLSKYFIFKPDLGQKGGGFSSKIADYPLPTTSNQLPWKHAEVLFRCRWEMLSIQHVLTLPLGLFPAWPDAWTVSALDAKGQQLHCELPPWMSELLILSEKLQTVPVIICIEGFHSFAHYQPRESRIWTHPDNVAESLTHTSCIHRWKHR